MRYLGAKYGYLPKSDDEQYQCDNFCETFYDIFQVVLQSTITGQQNPAIITEAVMKIREFLKGQDFLKINDFLKFEDFRKLQDCLAIQHFLTIQDVLRAHDCLRTQDALKI